MSSGHFQGFGCFISCLETRTQASIEDYGLDHHPSVKIAFPQPFHKLTPPMRFHKILESKTSKFKEFFYLLEKGLKEKGKLTFFSVYHFQTLTKYLTAMLCVPQNVGWSQGKCLC